MNRLAMLTVALPIALTGCITSAKLGAITTDVSVAIQSAQVLVQQARTIPAVAGNAKVQSAANRLSAVLATGSADIGTINTLAALLLNVAGTAGVSLPGL